MSEAKGKNGAAVWKIRVDDIRTVRPWAEWQRATAQANPYAMLPIIIDRVEEWPFDIAIPDEATPDEIDRLLDTLTPAQFREVGERMTRALGNVFQG